eukprot:426088-Pelagomonas_calceolata.AAC.4
MWCSGSGRSSAARPPTRLAPAPTPTRRPTSCPTRTPVGTVAWAAAPTCSGSSGAPCPAASALTALTSPPRGPTASVHAHL